MLIGAGGQIECLNEKSTNQSYISEVTYKEHLFLFVDQNPQIFVIEGLKRY